MNIAGIRSFLRVILISIIIDLPHFVSAVEHRNSGLRKHIGVQHNVFPDRIVHLLLVLLETCAFYAAHGCSSGTESCVSCHGICIVKFTAADTAFCLTLEIIIQILFMRHFLHAPCLKGIVVQSPANVVVASEIIQECILSREGAHNIHLFSQKTDISCGNCIPRCSHRRHIVKHMALRLLYGSEIRRHFIRLHNHFSQKHNARTHNLSDHTHHADNCVHLFQIAAVRTQLFPDIRDGVNSDNIHSLVRQVKEVVHHLVKHPGISVIQIPLIRVKCCHYIMSHFRQISEISRRCCRKYLRNGLFILPRNRGICVEEITAHIFTVSLPGLYSPLMILRRMVHNKIHAQTDSPVMTLFRQFSQIVHCAKLRLHLAEICHRISSV